MQILASWRNDGECAGIEGQALMTMTDASNNLTYRKMTDNY